MKKLFQSAFPVTVAIPHHLTNVFSGDEGMSENKMFRLNVAAQRGVILNGVLFRPEERKTADTVMIAHHGHPWQFLFEPVLLQHRRYPQ